MITNDSPEVFAVFSQLFSHKFIDSNAIASTKSEWLSFHDVNHVKFRILTLWASQRAEKNSRHFHRKDICYQNYWDLTLFETVRYLRIKWFFFSSIVMTVSCSSFFLKNINRKGNPECLLMKIFSNVSLFLRVLLGQCSITEFKVKTRLERSFSLYAFKTTPMRYF